MRVRCSSSSWIRNYILNDIDFLDIDFIFIFNMLQKVNLFLSIWIIDLYDVRHSHSSTWSYIE